jgi:hypothetical protein
MYATARLAHLLELAQKGPALRAALAEEVAELLIDWPGDCPKEMRGPCEALLARAAREVDSKIRARLWVRLHADPALAARVLPRNETVSHDLIAAARKDGDIRAPLAQALNLPPARVEEILADPSGRALAVVCKGLRLSRVTYSTLAVLTGSKEQPDYARLDRYDAVETPDAVRQLQDWRITSAVQHAA